VGKTWRNGTQNSKHLRRITTKQQVKSGPKLYNCITSRTQISQLARLRTGYRLLNQYLYRFGIEGSPICGCSSGSIESVEYYLLCSWYDRQRVALMEKVGIGKGEITGLPQTYGIISKKFGVEKNPPFPTLSSRPQFGIPCET